MDAQSTPLPPTNDGEVDVDKTPLILRIDGLDDGLLGTLSLEGTKETKPISDNPKTFKEQMKKNMKELARMGRPHKKRRSFVLHSPL